MVVAEGASMLDNLTTSAHDRIAVFLDVHLDASWAEFLVFYIVLGDLFENFFIPANREDSSAEWYRSRIRYLWCSWIRKRDRSECPQNDDQACGSTKLEWYEKVGHLFLETIGFMKENVGITVDSQWTLPCFSTPLCISIALHTRYRLLHMGEAVEREAAWFW